MSQLFWYPGYEILIPDIVRGENGRVFDSAGHSYVDLESGVWCLSLGHAHPRVTRVLAEQAATLAHTGYNYTHEVVEQGAGEILDLLGFPGGRCVFLCSGSEAVEYGVRVARLLLARPLLLTMSDSYFGAYGSAAARRPDEWYDFDWSGCAACAQGGGCGPDCERWLAVPFDRIGGFLFEPGSSSGLVRFPPPALIASLARRVQEEGGLLLVNEVTTGVGRTGRWFGHQHYPIAPDIAALGKGLGAGYPVAVAAVSANVSARLGTTPIRYAQSHQNDPLGAAVAREVLRTIREEGLIERGRQMGARLWQGLDQLRERTDRIRDLRGRGLMIALELEDDPQTSFTHRLQRELARRGYLVARRPGLSVIRIDPPLTVAREDLDGFLRVLGEILDAET